MLKMARVTFSKHGINPVEKVNLESFIFAVFLTRLSWTF